MIRRKMSCGHLTNGSMPPTVRNASGISRLADVGDTVFCRECGEDRAIVEDCSTKEAPRSSVAPGGQRSAIPAHRDVDHNLYFRVEEDD